MSKNEIILSGEFDSDNLEKILEICMEEVKDFVIHFHMNSEMTATIYVKDGILEDAILGPYGGLHVLALLSDDVAGSFDLCSWEEPDSYSIQLPVSSALLTAAVQFDENKYKLRKTISDTIDHIEHHDGPFRLSGKLEKISLEKLLVYVADLSKACVVDLTLSPEIEAQVYIKNNLVFDAKLGDLNGLKAFGLILEHAESEYNVSEYNAEMPNSISLEIQEAIVAAKAII